MGKWNNDYQYHNDSWSVKNNWKKSSRNDYRNSSWHKSDRPRSYWRSESYGSNDNDTVSKWLTWVLRHGASEEDVHMNKHGYVSVDELIALREKEHGKTTNLYQIRLVVETCPKQRFELWEDEETSKAYVRATQGHSISKVQDSVHRPLRNAEDLGNEEPVHGTFLHSWLKIRNEGLKTMGRNHIHMCMGLPGTGVISGMREDADVAIYINVAMAMKSGVSFVQSSNGVILTTGEGDTQTLSTRYFSRVLWLAPSSEHVLIWSCERGDLLEAVRKENEELELALGRAEWEKPKKPAAKKMPMPKKMPESLQRPGAMRPPEPEVPPSNLAPTMCKAASPGVPPLPPPPPPVKEHIHGLEEAPWRQNYPQIQDGSSETPRRPGMQPENVSKSEKWPKEQDQWPERSEGHDVRRFLQGQTEEHNSKWEDSPWQEGWERSVPSRPPVQKPPVPPPAKHDGQNFFLKEHRSKWDQPWQDGWELSMPSRSSVGDLPVAPPPKKEKAPDRHWDSWNEPDSPQNPNHVPLPNWARVDQSSRMFQEGAAPRSEMGYHNDSDSKHHNMTSAMVPHASSSAAGNLQPNERPVRHHEQQHDEQWRSDMLAQKRFDNLPAPRSEMGYHNESDSKHHNMTSAMVPHASSSAAANVQADVRNSAQKEQQWQVSNSLPQHSPQNTQPHVQGLQGAPAPYPPRDHSNPLHTQYQGMMPLHLPPGWNLTQYMQWCYENGHVQQYQVCYQHWQWYQHHQQLHQQQMASKQPAASLSHHSEEKKQKDEAQLSREHMDILNHSNKCQAQRDESRSIPSQDVEKSQMGVTGLVMQLQNGDRRINSQEPAIVTSQAQLVPYQVSDSDSSDSESESVDKSIDRSSDREKEDDTELRSKLTKALSHEAEKAEKAEREQAILEAQKAEKMQQEEAEAKRRKAEEEAEAKRRKAEEEAEAKRRKAEEEAQAKRKKEAEEEAEAKRRKAEAQRRKAEEDAAEAKRRKTEEDAAEAKRRKAEEDAAEAKRRKAEEDAAEAKRRKAEEDPAEEKRKKTEEDAAEPKRRKAEEDPAEEKQKKAAEAKQRKAKQEDRRNREERRLRAEHEKRNQETQKNEVGELSPQKTESVAKDTKVEKKEEQDVETVKSSAKAEFLNQKLEEAKNSQKESTVAPNGSSKVSEGVQERRIEPEAKIGELKKILQSKKIAKQKEETEKAPKSGKVKLVKLDSDEEVQTSPPKDKKSKSQDDRFHSPPARAAKPKKKAQLSSARHVLLKEARSPSNERSENSGHHQASHSNHSKRRREPSRHRKSASRRARSKRRRDSSHRSSPSRREPRRSRSKERSDSSSSSTSNSEEKRKKAARAAKAKKTKVDKVAQSTQKQQKEAAETAKKTKGKVDQSPRRSSKGKEKPSKEEKRKVRKVD